MSGDGFKDAFGARKFTWNVAHPTAGKCQPATTTRGSSDGNTYTHPGN